MLAFGAGGFVWGVVARLWMRVISGDPEFSWSGTLFIIGLFTVVGGAQGLALAVRRRRWPRWAQTIVRIPTTGVAVLLGAAAGIVMLPALVTGSLGLGRTDWPRAVRVALGAVAAVNTVAVFAVVADGIGWGRAVVGWALMVVVYAVIIAALALNLRPLDDGWRTSRRALSGFAAGAVAFIVVLVALASRGV